MPVKMDWTQSEGSGFEPLEAGSYEATLTDVTEKTSKSNNQMFEWTFSLKEGNRKLWHTTSLQPQALFNLRRLLTGLGMTDEEVASFADSTALLLEIRKRYLSKTYMVTVNLVPRNDGQGLTNRVTSVVGAGEAVTADSGKLW